MNGGAHSFIRKTSPLRSFERYSAGRLPFGGFCSRNLRGPGNEYANLILKIARKILVALACLVMAYELVYLLWLGEKEGWSLFSWMESTPEFGPSTQAKPEDVAQFDQFMSYDGNTSNSLIDCLVIVSVLICIISAWVLWVRKRRFRQILPWRKIFFWSLAVFVGASGIALSGFFSNEDDVTDEDWAFFANQLQVGDVIAYRKEKWDARSELFAKGELTVVGYPYFKYGNLAIVVEDPGFPGRKALFTSHGVKRAKLEENLDSLRAHNWDAYRLDKWDRIDMDRIREAILSCQSDSGPFFGYDFPGMLTLWSKNFDPDQASEFSTEFVCSTSLVTLLYFGGFESDATPRQQPELITPYQVVRARGRFTRPPELPSPD